MTSLEILEDEHVFSVGFGDANKTCLSFVEECDNYFQTCLNKKEVLNLIAGLQALADQMKGDSDG